MTDTLLLESPVGTLRVAAPNGYRLNDVEWFKDGVLAHVAVEEPVDRCVTCGKMHPRRYGRRDIRILDAPSAGVRTRMLVVRQITECLTCNRFSREPLPGVAEGHRYTGRCADWMKSQFPVRSNVAIASVLGLDEKSVRLFASEEGITTSRRDLRGADLLTCASCLRLLSAEAGWATHIHHPPPSSPGTGVTALCADCHANADQRWVTRA